MIDQTIAHFRITAKLGEGGMGTVYRAEDSKLGRAVALKFLPEAFAADAERMGRFTREAQVLASLNHPNIAGIYSVEEAPREGSDVPLRFLVMELVEGETLQDRIDRGALELSEALQITLQIATVFPFWRWTSRWAASVSAVSPDWEMSTVSVLSVRIGAR